ncbi:MAG: CapA family protein [Lachnospiraceae bacterium]|nr:CapA family protein [Lachnospiraceae bacterium]
MNKRKRYGVYLLLSGAVLAGLLSGCQKQKIQECAAAETVQTVCSEPEPETEPVLIEIEPDTEPEPAGEPEPVTLLFAGDVLLSDHVMNAYQKGGGIAGVLDEGYRTHMDQADFFFVNEEFPFSDRGTQAPDKQYTFRLSPEKVSVLQEMGVDGVSLANNHALDFGSEALLDTCETLDQAGILHTGAGHNLNEAKLPVLMEQNGMRIAVIGATRVIPVADWAAGNNHPGMLATYDPTVLLEEIRRLSEEQDYVIVYVHWGIERKEYPEEYQRTLAKQYIDAGADLVIGSHPHVLQGIEYYKGSPIVYSMGNFVFGSSIPRTMLLEVTLSEGQEAALRILPGTSSAGYTQMLRDDGQLREFCRYMEQISFGVGYGADGSVSPQP